MTGRQPASRSDNGAATPHDALDPIGLEILANGLRSVVDETFHSLMRSAYSTNIKERRDHSTGFLDASGRLICQAAESLPIHLASMMGMVERVLERHGDTLAEGDIFVANDPHTAGGTHLPDINMAMPVFVDGRLLGFMCNLAHHADVGGAVPGSMSGGLSEIYQEGLRIPAIRLFQGGNLLTDVMDLLLLNARVPTERRGDYFAQVAACRLGARRMEDIAGRYGADTLNRAFDRLIDATARRLRQAVAEVPDGSYRFRDVMDDDGLGTTDFPIELTVTVAGERIIFDFTGTSTQVPGNINATLNSTQASVCYALKALLDPEVEHNQGVLDVAEIRTERGSLVDAVFPAPVAGRAHTCQRVVDVIIGALADALPRAAVAAANGANTTAVFAGRDPRNGASYVYLETLGGGFGGRYARDGADGVQVHITNTSNLPVEAIEMEYPLRVESYGFVPDSGGAGRHRGGLGLRRVIRPIGHDAIFNGAGERFSNAPWGLAGGGEGGRGSFRKIAADGSLTTLPAKPQRVDLHSGDAIIVQTPGAGGYGRPTERPAVALGADLRSGKFSAGYLRSHYGDDAVAEAERLLEGRSAITSSTTPDER